MPRGMAGALPIRRQRHGLNQCSECHPRLGCLREPDGRDDALSVAELAIRRVQAADVDEDVHVDALDTTAKVRASFYLPRY